MEKSKNSIRLHAGAAWDLAHRARRLSKTLSIEAERMKRYADEMEKTAARLKRETATAGTGTPAVRARNVK